MTDQTAESTPEPDAAPQPQDELAFKGSPEPSLGVELELQIIDRESGDLAPGAVRILKLCQEQKIDGVAAANDGLGGAVAAVLKRNGDTDKVPTTGQDATVEGLQRVLTGAQCMTVYKAIKKEADAASRLAIALNKGDQAGADSQASGSVEDTESGDQVKSVLLQPQAIFKDNVQDVIDDGFVSASDVCRCGTAKATTTAPRCAS